jgi:hypothetical protein
MCNWRNADNREGALVSQPFAWAEVRDIIPYLFLFIKAKNLGGKS